METIKVVQIGLGPLGAKIANFISERKGIETVAAVDKNPNLIGMDVAQTYGGPPSGIVIKESLSDALENKAVDVAVLATVSDLERITSQLEVIFKHKIPVVSTCEELFYPWDVAPELAKIIDEDAKKAGVAVIGTGVNPGYLMDALPSYLTTACQLVESIEINRFQNASARRIPFQKKIGAGLSIPDFEERKEAGLIRHVGLTESMQFIAKRMGWELDHTEDIVNPVIAHEDVVTSYLTIPKGHVTGVSQIGRAYADDQLKISLIFQATIGEKESYDEVVIKGEPHINSKIKGGVNGDIATSAVIINTIPQILKASPGLKTMGDISMPSFFP